MKDDKSPIQSALTWLSHITIRQPSSAEFDHIAESVLPKARREYEELLKENERLKKMVLVGRPLSHECED